ncbi:MAG: acyl carrier protein [Flavobacteriales bacterium]|nr:acyl carrier protein [Flavobacteriales bacterium]
MERTAIIERIRTIVTNVVGHGNFEMRDDLVAADVAGWDSLTHMTIITQLEAGFGVRFKLREVNKLKNMGSLVELVASKVAS